MAWRVLFGVLRCWRCSGASLQTRRRGAEPERVDEEREDCADDQELGEGAEHGSVLG